jgi:hypothetical protein
MSVIVNGLDPPGAVPATARSRCSNSSQTPPVRPFITCRLHGRSSSPVRHDCRAGGLRPVSHDLKQPIIRIPANRSQFRVSPGWQTIPFRSWGNIALFVHPLNDYHNATRFLKQWNSIFPFKSNGSVPKNKL